MPCCWVCGEQFETGADHACLDERVPEELVPDGMLKDMQDRLAAAIGREHYAKTSATRRKPKQAT